MIQEDENRVYEVWGDHLCPICTPPTDPDDHWTDL